MKIAFTGTQHGMTEEQIKALLKALMYAIQIVEVHHGDCIGADAQFHDLIRKIAPPTTIKIIGHPASDVAPEKRAHKQCDELRDPKPALERNKIMVDECTYLIATPKTALEMRRSGTWSTIRYAKSIEKGTFIIEPDGSMQIFTDEKIGRLTRL